MKNQQSPIESAKREIAELCPDMPAWTPMEKMKVVWEFRLYAEIIEGTIPRPHIPARPPSLEHN